MSIATNFIHAQAIVEEGAVLGENTRVWAFAHVLSGAVIGDDCNLCDHIFIENDVVVGDRVTIKCGVQLWDGVRLEDDVFVGPNATFTNDRYPRSKQYPAEFATTIVCAGASIGANATILPGLKIGRGAMVGAGAVVTRDVPPNAIVVGNPARITGYVNTPHAARGKSAVVGSPAHTESGAVPGVRIHTLKTVQDLRGDLTVAEWEKDIPFKPCRVFFVYGVPNARVRGEHAHRVCEQFLVCLRGQLAVMADDGQHRGEYLLDRPGMGLYLPPRVWGTQYRYSADALLSVFASHPYDPDDYIRDYEQFLKEVSQ